MQKYVPYVFPSIACAVVLLLAVRWYTVRVQRSPQLMPFASDVSIKELSSTESVSFLKESAQLPGVELTPKQAGALGEVRYEIKDDRMTLSVQATLEDTTQTYQVWFKDKKSSALKRAFTLTPGKGGYIGTASVPAALFPFDVVVSSESTPGDDTLETVLLEGVLDR